MHPERDIEVFRDQEQPVCVVLPLGSFPFLNSDFNTVKAGTGRAFDPDGDRFPV